MRVLSCQRNVDVVSFQRVIKSFGLNMSLHVTIGESGDLQHGKACRWNWAGSAWGVVMSRRGTSLLQSRGALSLSLAQSRILGHAGWTLFPIQICLAQGWEDNPCTQSASLWFASCTNTFVSNTSGFTRILESWHPVLLSSEIRPYRLLSPQLSLQRKMSIENEDQKLVNQSDTQIKKTLIEYQPQFSYAWHLSVQILIVDMVSLFKAVMGWCMATIWGDTLQGNGASSWAFHLWVNVWVSKDAEISQWHFQQFNYRSGCFMVARILQVEHIWGCL